MTYMLPLIHLGLSIAAFVTLILVIRYNNDTSRIESVKPNNET